MKRREAIKIVTMLFGSAAAGPALGGLAGGWPMNSLAGASDKEAAKKVLRTLFDEVLTQNKLDLIDELYHEDYSFIVPKLAGMTSNVVHGREAFKNRVISFRTSFPDVVYGIEDIVSDGEIVATNFAFTGTHEKEFAGFAPTNKVAKVTGVHFAQLVDGRIKKTWAGFTNVAEALAPMPAEEETKQ